MSGADDGLRLSGISKRFGATRALVDAELDLHPGEVHTLLGENGSGKSTLVKIIGGVHSPDTGSLTLDGQALTLRNPRQANGRGIAVVFQEVLTATSQSVLDNIWLGTDGVFSRRLGRAAQRSLAAETLGRLIDGIDLDAPAGDLSLSERQAVCIVRALVREPGILVLDESTAALDVQTRDRLFAEIRRLTSHGVSVLFISHRMDEVQEISDRVSVLRSGRTVSTVDRDSLSVERLIADMTGTSGVLERITHDRPLGDATLRVEGVRLTAHADPIDLTLRAGELVGIAGLEGHGQDLFLKRLAGVAEGPGSVIRVLSPDIPVRSGNGARLGVAYLPRERRGESLFESMSIRDNFALPTLGADRRGPLLSAKRMRERFTEFVSALSIRLGTQEDPISSLSGGSQQKVVLARWLATDPRVLLLNDPTRGVDIMTKREIYATLDRLCADGMSIVMLSSEVEELVELVDRVLVFRDQAVFAEIPREQLTSEAVVAAYFGQQIGQAA
ncbi:sugar ABC transporter ATP-binding protein [Microbacterium sp. C7(2022)]|uniref:sugar ABC transporter ATP-binding protein n=1 Tax=Microbacterium sp. C7(2022) TaxID=2992759 RepID=UPI00237BA0D1|nr:sugar ABC transporter ATP-binding protein [Microbacterium sp. C7(2022)]MDE0545991.1 sugar ABC transporter ATP-binding protein [Microbacterium sp. C7(2022)]